MATDTKERILAVTAELFRRYGYTGTGLKQIVQAANAPFGSVYHHFPGGKQELGTEVIKRSGQMYFELVAGIFDAAPDIVTGVEDAFRGAREVLIATDYEDACPIETVALEVASSNETLRIATAEVFDSWVDGAVERFVVAGVGAARARELAWFMIGALEGAFVLCRATKNVEPMDAARKAVVEVLHTAMDAR